MSTPLDLFFSIGLFVLIVTTWLTPRPHSAWLRTLYLIFIFGTLACMVRYFLHRGGVMGEASSAVILGLLIVVIWRISRRGWTMWWRTL